jgi:hypothetical protein
MIGRILASEGAGMSDDASGSARRKLALRLVPFRWRVDYRLPRGEVRVAQSDRQW